MLEDPQKLGQGRTSHSVTERQPCSISEWLTNFPNRKSIRITQLPETNVANFVRLLVALVPIVAKVRSRLRASWRVLPAPCAQPSAIRVAVIIPVLLRHWRAQVRRKSLQQLAAQLNPPLCASPAGCSIRQRL
jgi:hypothetical protein